MTDKTDSQSEPMKPAVVVRRAPPKAPSQPSFEDILAGKPAEPPRPPQPKSEPPPPRPQAQPTFDDILAKAAPAIGDAPSAEAPRGEQRKDRPLRPPRREQRMPIVIRKGQIAKPAEGEETPAASSVGEAPKEGAAAAEPHAAEGGSEAPRKQRREPRPQQPMAESMFATPSAEEDQDFAALFAEAGERRPGKLKLGQRVSAKVAHLGAEVAFLDLGGKGEGIIDLRELRNDKGEMLVQQGEKIDGYVLSLGGPDSGVVITRSIPKGAGREQLAAAMEGRMPVEGTVTGHNKGGLEVELGGTRAFVPASQVDIRFVDDQSQFVGQKLK